MPTSDIELKETKNCAKCDALIASDCTFCTNCGAHQSILIGDNSENKLAILITAAVFYLVDIIVCFSGKFIDEFKTFLWSLFFDVVLATAAVAFFINNWADNKQLLNWKSFSWQKLAAYCGIAMLASLLVHYTVGWLNITVYSSDDNYYSSLKGNWVGEVLLVFFVAVMPAIFEELAYRGYLLQSLLKIVDREQAIYISSFLFAILHLSFISLFWLIPFALFLGYARIRENTIWYGVLFHFTFNLTSCMLDVYHR